MLEDIYNKRYETGYREEITGYEVARYYALKHFISRSIETSSSIQILDYGSGSGLFLGLWKSIFPFGIFHFADISSVALSQLVKKHPEYKESVHLINKDKINLPSSSFDVIVSIEVMEHVENLEAYLDEIFRLLKPGGRFIWTTPCANSFSIEHIYTIISKQVERTKEGYRRWGWEDPTHIRRLKSTEIELLLKKQTFSSVKFGFRSHFFSFVCSQTILKKFLPRKLSERLMRFDYEFFRKLPNGASMIGCAEK